MISLIAPAYNEEEVIAEFVESVCRGVRLDEPWELIVVNDGSTDKTGAILTEMQSRYPSLRVLTHAFNQNLGGALRTGIGAARGSVIVTMDADMAHPPQTVALMVQEIGPYDVCIASRFVAGGGMIRVPFHRRLISRAANSVYRALFRSPVSDNTGGFKAYKAALLQSLPIEEKGFAVQLEIMTRLLNKGVRFKEIPLMLTNRDKGISKLNYLRMLPAYSARLLRLLTMRWGWS